MFRGKEINSNATDDDFQNIGNSSAVEGSHESESEEESEEYEEELDNDKYVERIFHEFEETYRAYAPHNAISESKLE